MTQEKEEYEEKCGGVRGYEERRDMSIKERRTLCETRCSVSMGMAPSCYCSDAQNA
jgi:hypothetical protein